MCASGAVPMCEERSRSPQLPLPSITILGRPVAREAAGQGRSLAPSVAEEMMPQRNASVAAAMALLWAAKHIKSL